MAGETTLIPGWRIVRLIGKGSYGAVYEVEKEGDFGRTVHSALKVISIPETDAEVRAYRDDGYDEMSLTALFRSQVEDITAEFEMMSKLKGHSNIVSYEDHTIVQHNDDPGYDVFIRMEMLTSLPDFINKSLANGLIADSIVIDLGIDICSALELCQYYHIIHRDIKPQNIFINEHKDFKLGDFGIAKTSDHTTKATKTGTYGYMAPEVYLGKAYNSLVDIYSLGLVMYWMLNERRSPFLPLPPIIPKPSQNAEALERRMSGEPLPDPKNGGEELKRIVLKACAYNMEDRYANPTDMKRDLQRLADKLKHQTENDPYYEEPEEYTVELFSEKKDRARVLNTVSGQIKEKNTEPQEAVAEQMDEGDATVGIFHRSFKENTGNHQEKNPLKTDDSAKKKEPEESIKTQQAEQIKQIGGSPEVKTSDSHEKSSDPHRQEQKKTTGSDSQSKKKGILIGVFSGVVAIALVAAFVVLVLGNKKQPVSTVEKQTQKPTELPTEAPTEALTESSTEEPTETPTESPTEEPITEPTETPKEEPTATPDAVVTFKDAAFEMAFRNAYGLSETDEIHMSSILNMTELYLSECNLADISDLAKFKNLKVLDISFNNISNLKVLKKLKNLETVVLTGNPYSQEQFDEIIDHFGQQTQFYGN